MRDRAESDPKTCVFCRHEALRNILHETEHFFLLADHAPVVEGHILILPREHFACFGSVPASLDSELFHLKAKVTDFFRQTYQTPVFFEHGVYHQTVFHAHLHALPIGSFPEEIARVAAAEGAFIEMQSDIRAWHQAHGHYFYLERLAGGDNPSQATIFPPNEQLYRQVLGILRDQTGDPGGWRPQPLRRLTGDNKVQSLADAWQSYMSGAVRRSAM
ncbi:MAG: HIT family protein [Ktedonobacterales bacterium]